MMMEYFIKIKILSADSIIHELECFVKIKMLTISMNHNDNIFAKIKNYLQTNDLFNSNS